MITNFSNVGRLSVTSTKFQDRVYFHILFCLQLFFSTKSGPSANISTSFCYKFCQFHETFPKETLKDFSISYQIIITYRYEESFLYSRTRHERKRLEQQEKCIFEYRLFAFEYKYYIVSITFLIHYKNIHLVCPKMPFNSRSKFVIVPQFCFP
jgi:hypothetical protein